MVCEELRRYALQHDLATRVVPSRESVNREAISREPVSRESVSREAISRETISREAIVKRIKRYAGETYTFEDFVSNDKRDAAAADSRNADTWSRRSRAAATLRHSSDSYRQHAPTIHRGSPLTLAKVRKKR